MTEPLFLSILLTGFAVAFLHGALPTHWLPFVLVGRRQGWATGRTLLVTALAGFGHVITTVVLGLLLVASGLAAGETLGRFVPYIAGGLLIALGLYYLANHSFAAARHNHHLPLFKRFHIPEEPGEERGPAMSDRSAVLGLVTVLTLSPCEAFLPVYLSGAPYGWEAFGLLSVVLTCAAVASMVGFAGLSMAGARWLGLKAVERSEGLVLGAALCALGVLVIVLER
jgi:hypothetical protein